MKSLLVTAFLLVFTAPIARAVADVPHDPPPATDAAAAKPAEKAADKEGFVPVKEGESLGPGETLPATGLVAGAYGFILGAMIIWVASVAMRTRRVEEDVDALRAKIERVR